MADDALLELIGEAKVAAVHVGERFLADNGDQLAEVTALSVRGVHLVGDSAMVLAGLALADTQVHKAAQAGQHVDRRVDRPAVELAREHDLTLGNVAGKVGDRVRDVIVRHGEDRQLRDGALAALDAAGALVDGREVGVHVSRESSATRHLFARGRDLAKRLAVVGHVGEDHENLQILLEREVLGDRECGLRRQETLDRGVVGEVQEEDDALDKRRCPRTAA